MYPKIAESCFILHFIVFYFCNCYCLSSSSSSSSWFNLRLAGVQLLKPKQISLSYVNSTNLFEILFKDKTIKLFPFPLKTWHKSAKWRHMLYLYCSVGLGELNQQQQPLKSTKITIRNNKNNLVEKQSYKYVYLFMLQCTIVKSWPGYQENQIEL